MTAEQTQSTPSAPVKWSLDESQCVGCAICADVCPEGALSLAADELLPVWRADLCTACRQCAEQCPTGAIVMHEQADVRAPSTARR
ncbi:MAG: 4Fe-4S binding protein [Armatimonadetes bacterium]|nr:4Fe-4S binding protein [Armatimonadota bacterium]